MTAEQLDLTLYDIQPDPTTGNLGNRCSSTKARMENQLQDFFLIQHLIFFDEAQAKSLSPNLSGINAFTVITEGNDNICSLAANIQYNSAHFRLVQCKTLSAI